MASSEEYVEKGLVKYTSRDYTSILEDFWSLVPKMTELWTPEAESDPGVVLGKFLASVADMLGVNLDSLATEVYAPTVRQRKDAERLFALVGYELGWYTAARTEVTFTNNTDSTIKFDFGFNGSNFATLNAYTDITDQARVITYNILPLTNTYGSSNSRSTRTTVSSDINVFVDTDEVSLGPGESVTRVAVEGEFRYYAVSVESVRKNNYIINIPSQHIDTTAIWIKAKASRDADDFLATQWIQVASPSEFITPEPRFAVTYDSYSNAQIQISNYLDQMETYDSSSYLMIYWIDCSGVIGCVGQDVLSNYLQAKPTDGSLADEASNEWSISNLSNTVELPNTYTVTGKSPETAKEAYYNSRNYINTWDSLITLPDFNRFLNREAGVDCGLVLDCQKALDTNLAIYQDSNLTDTEKRKMYITNYDFPQGESDIDWLSKINTDMLVTQTTHRVTAGETILDIAQMYGVALEELLSYNNLTETSELYPGYLIKIPVERNSSPSANFITNFKTYTAVCYAIHNDFAVTTNWGRSQTSSSKYANRQVFIKYRPPQQFIEAVKRDFRPLQAMSVELEFGDVRVFPFYIAGQIYTKKPVSNDVALTIIAQVKENLAIYFSPANRSIGQKPTTMEIVKVIQNSDTRIDYFDAGSATNPVIVWTSCDPEYFNAVSFARLVDPGVSATNLTVAPECIVSTRR